MQLQLILIKPWFSDDPQMKTHVTVTKFVIFLHAFRMFFYY